MTTPTALRTTRHPGWTLAIVCVATFMLLLDVTIVTVALSAIQRDFSADLGELQWVIDAYTLALAGLLLTAATLGDRIGRRRIFLAGMAIFTAGSLGCALAWSPLSLDLIRAVQGIGGALLFGVGLPLIGAAFPQPKARASAVGVFGATLAAATAVGPLAGGLLVDGPGWRWIFLVNVPIGVFALIAGARWLTESRPEHARAADWPGTVLLTSALLALLLGLIRGNDDGWGSARVVGLLVAAGVLLAGFLVRQATAAQPMLDLSLFARRSFVGVGFAAFAVSASLIACTTYLALYVINALDYSPLQGGLRFLPLTVAAFVAAPITARLVDRVPARIILGASLGLIAVGMALDARLDGGSHWTALLVGFVVAGVGMGAASASTAQAALESVEVARAGMATGTVNTLRQIGVAAGVAVFGAVFQHRTGARMTEAVSGLPLTPQQGHQLSSAVSDGAGVRVADAVPAPLHGAVAAAARTATAAGLDVILASGAVFAGVAAVVAVLLIRREARPAPLPEESREAVSVG
jgi:EmrB/QacA subfamily drug resistance transporter